MGREQLPVFREGLGGLLGGPGGVGRSSQWSGRGREDLSYVRKGFVRPSQWSERGRKDLPDVREESGGPPGGPGGVGRPHRGP